MSGYDILVGCENHLPAHAPGTAISGLPTRADLTDLKKPWPYVGLGSFLALLGGAYWLDTRKKGKRKK